MRMIRGGRGAWRGALWAVGALIALGTLACAGGTPPEGSAPAALADDAAPRSDRLEALLGTLAADAMEGRRTATEGERRAAHFLASELERYGVQPAGDDGFLQAVPLVMLTDARGRERWQLAPDDVDPDTLPAERRTDAFNVLGVVPGTDPALAGQVVIVGAHFDHLGVGRPVDGDSIYNGADDDGSGSVATLEIARDLARVSPPGRTVVVALFTGEEMGLLGTRWFIDHPPVAFDSIVADLEIEMIGRPDSLAGGPGGAWLTGYERSTMGDILAAQGSPIVPDPRPDQRFYFRSDNIALARLGIPAHTLSSFNLHEDYHRPSDEVGMVDFDHMASVVDAAVLMVRALASGPKPAWKEGGQPGAPGAPGG